MYTWYTDKDDADRHAQWLKDNLGMKTEIREVQKSEDTIFEIWKL